MILLFALAKLVLHLATSSGYGYFRDELYYLACTEHLALGYVDHPTLSVLLLWGVRHTLGTSLWAIRLLPALAGAATVGLVGWMARRLGGGRLAQALALSCALIAGQYLALDHFYSMNAFEILAWAGAAALLIRLLAEEGEAEPRTWGRLWVALGGVLALGLANKISVLWLGAGIGAGMLLTPRRRWLATPWPWIAGGIAALGLLPYLAWQVQNGWPTREFVRNAGSEKMAHVAPLDFLLGQIESMHPFTLPLWLGGLAWLLFAAPGRRFRLLGCAYLTVLAILIANGTSRSGYFAPAYTWLFAAGGVAAESLLRRPWPRRLGWAGVWLLLAGGILAAPFALPLLPVARYIAYGRLLGVQPDTEERKEIGALPQFYADMHGWPEIVDTVEGVYRSLPAAERRRTGIFAPDYGIAGAIDHYGPARGLPHAASGHNNFWLWGPGRWDGGPLIVIGGRKDDLEGACARVERRATLDCGYCMPYENGRPVWLCTGLKVPAATLWPQLKHYD